MKRREFLTIAAAGIVTIPFAASAAETIEYGFDGDVQALLDDGKTVFVDFYTTWCSTCQAQERIIHTLRRDNPQFDEAMVFVNVDWDAHASSALSKRLRIPRRSTLVVLKGDKELGRIVAGTATDQIKALMEAGAAAASA